MSRIVFESERPLISADPLRADVACFAGLARCLDGAALSPAVLDWLERQGWTTGPFARPLNPVFDIPIPIENYGVFQSLFDTGATAASAGTDYLAAAVRTFFAQGGKRCYIVRMGDPVTSAELDGLLVTLKSVVGITLVIVTHELASIFAIADRCILLDKETKAIIATGAPTELKESDDARVSDFFNRRPRAA